MKIELSEELKELFKNTSFVKEDVDLFDLDTYKPIDTKPDEDGFVYLPETTILHPTTLVRNGYNENDINDYLFIKNLINEVKKQLI